MSVVTLIKFLNSSNSQIGDNLISKGFRYIGKKTTTEPLYRDVYLWSSRANNELLKKHYIYDVVYGMKDTFIGFTISYDVHDANKYLTLKKQLPALGFKLVKEDERGEAFVSIYENQKYILKIWTVPAGWETSVQDKELPVE